MFNSSNVSFGYNEAEPILQEMNFQAEPGETVALVGPSGAGKSTLISLIPRFYDPQQGSILIDTTPTKEIQIQFRYAPHIGIVFQDPYLFAESIAYNIRLGAEDPDAVTHEHSSRRRKVSKRTRLHHEFPRTV